MIDFLGWSTGGRYIIETTSNEVSVILFSFLTYSDVYNLFLAVIGPFLLLDNVVRWGGVFALECCCANMAVHNCEYSISTVHCVWLDLCPMSMSIRIKSRSFSVEREIVTCNLSDYWELFRLWSLAVYHQIYFIINLIFPNERGSSISRIIYDCSSIPITEGSSVSLVEPSISYTPIMKDPDSYLIDFPFSNQESILLQISWCKLDSLSAYTRRMYIISLLIFLPLSPYKWFCNASRHETIEEILRKSVWISKC